MKFDVWTFLFEVVNFLVLVYVLRRLLYRPLHEAIDRRRDANAKAQADAEKAREETIAMRGQLATRMAALDHERQDVLVKAREQAEAERKATEAEAERAAQHRREEVERQLERERAEAYEALRGELVQSAMELAKRCLREASNATFQQQLVGRLVEELTQMPEDDRRRLRGELDTEEAAVVETSAALDGETMRSLDGVLESLAGRRVSLTVETRADLLSGVRLRFGGHVWDASLTGGLGDIESASA